MPYRKPAVLIRQTLVELTDLPLHNVSAWFLTKYGYRPRMA